MKKFLKYIKGNWFYTIIAPILMMIDALGSIIQPFFMAKIIDIGIANGDINYIIKIGIIMVIATIISMSAGFGCMYFSAKAAYGFAYNIRKEMMEKIQEFSFSNINRFKTSSLITRLTNDVNIVSNLFQMTLRIVIRAPFMFIGGSIMALLLNKKLSVIIVVLIPIIFIAVAIIMKKVTPYFSKVQNAIDKVNASIRENLKGSRVIKSFVREDLMEKKFDKANNNLKDISIESYNKMAIITPVILIVMNLTLSAIIWFGSKIAMNGGIEVGAISSFITYIMMILSSLIMMSMVFMNFARAKASSERIFEVINCDIDILNTNKDNLKQVEKGDVEFNVKQFIFKDSSGEEALKDIKFNVKHGEKVAIIGSTGCGKTTLVNLIPRFYDVTKGYVKVDNTDVKDYDINKLRDGIGMVLQENILFKGTIIDNIKWGNKNASLEEVRHVAKVAQIDDFIINLEKGYNTKISQRGTNLSGGQKQRICIARALLKNPKILILDDSVSALDATTEKNLTEALNKEYKDTTLFVITQRISSCKNCDYIIVMEEGKIVGKGTHQQLLKNNKVYKEINDSQLEVIQNA